MEDGKRDNHQLTRYYNVLASYHEWTGNYSLAIETYEKGLRIPGVDRSLISSLMVNKGIAYRFLGKESEKESDIFHYLREGILTNLEGVEAKEIIGNVDQLPIALHNLAETCIELAHRLPEGPEKTSYYQKGWTYSQKGLDINEQIHSSKKKGQLLVERFLASMGLAQIQTPEKTTLASESLCNWVRENSDKKGYDVDVVLDMLTRIGGYTGNSLEAVLPELSNNR
jgi:tetratricopeptide (TPR) repeat protein